ncbi:uncharacterized protein LOC122254207 isoform X3 [Penaeus japonicus]|nr:uncharacterized protein LOC122254207 isoform X3 [Penaeus japonicus]
MILLECQVCLECYDARKRVPRSLSCKHTLCTSCIAQIMRRGPLKCPFCRTLHAGAVISPVDVPVQGEMAALVLEDSSSKPDGTACESAPEASGVNVLKLRSDIQKANANGAHVWAVLRREGRGRGSHRCAKITVHDDRLHLHALKDGEPPKDSITVEYESVRGLVDEQYVVAFLELTWAGRVQGRVYIQLLDNAGRTIQFMYFCTGERGPSYADTRLLMVTLKGQPGEQLWGGDYENNDGTGGAALEGMERGEKNHQDVVAGLVAGYYYTGYGQDHNPSQFGIYLKDMPGYSEMSSIGRVLIGQDVLNSAASLNNIQMACVGDCGILLSY